MGVKHISVKQITRSDRGPNLSVQKKMKQNQVRIFAPKDVFSRIQWLLIHNFLTLQAMDSSFQVPQENSIESSESLIFFRCCISRKWSTIKHSNK